MIIHLKAHMEVESVKTTKTHEIVTMRPIGPTYGYDNGKDPDNNYSLEVPEGLFKLKINRPDMMGRFKPGMKIQLTAFDAKEEI